MYFFCMGLFKTEGLFLSTKQFRRFTGANSLEKGTKSPDIIERNVQRVGKCQMVGRE
jgi:hypothetical protein